MHFIAGDEDISGKHTFIKAHARPLMIESLPASHRASPSACAALTVANAFVAPLRKRFQESKLRRLQGGAFSSARVPLFFEVRVTQNASAGRPKNIQAYSTPIRTAHRPCQSHCQIFRWLLAKLRPSKIAACILKPVIHGRKRYLGGRECAALSELLASRALARGGGRFDRRAQLHRHDT